MEVCENIILSFIVFGTFNLVSPINIRETANASFSPHLDTLYQEYCGNTTFDMDDDRFNHFVPCCIPCSCLPGCQNMQKYCPEVVQLSDEDLNNQESLQTPANFNYKNVNIESLLFRDEPSLPNNLNESSNESANSANSNKSREIKTLLHDELDLSDALLANSGRNMSYVGGDLTDCVRPQIYYKINNHIDSQAYEMVISCPVEFLEVSTKDKCELGLKNDYLGDAIPVTSKLTGISYINQHCLVCNEHNDDKNISFVIWRPKLVARTTQFRIKFIESRQTVLRDIELYSSVGSNLIFVPPNFVSNSRCLAIDITSCNQTHLWEDYDNLIEEMCDSDTTEPVIHTIDRKRMLFKNLACFICNAGRTVLNCGYSVKRIQSVSALNLFSLTLNIQTLDWDESAKIPEIIPLSRLKRPKLTHLSAGVCQEGYVNIMNRCRKIYCANGQVINNNHCVPIYDALNGMQLHLKLKVTVSQAIDKKLRSVFADALKHLLSVSMEQKTSLASAETSVWYLPRSDHNPEEFYILNIYLFNSSNEIHYGYGIREIYEFLKILKLKSSLTLADDVNVQLRYDFAPQVEATYELQDKSINNGAKLIPLMDKGWKPIRPGPVMVVSDSNWCYRTELRRNEIQFYGTRDIKIIESGAVIYYDQYDKDFIGEYRLCIDYIDIDRENNVPVVNNDIILEATEDDKNSNPWYVSESAVLTWCVLGLVLLCTALYKVRHWAATKHATNREPGIENIEDK